MSARVQSCLVYYSTRMRLSIYFVVLAPHVETTAEGRRRMTKQEILMDTDCPLSYAVLVYYSRIEIWVTLGAKRLEGNIDV